MDPHGDKPLEVSNTDSCTMESAYNPENLGIYNLSNVHVNYNNLNITSYPRVRLESIGNVPNELDRHHYDYIDKDPRVFDGGDRIVSSEFAMHIDNESEHLRCFSDEPIFTSVGGLDDDKEEHKICDIDDRGDNKYLGYSNNYSNDNADNDDDDGSEPVDKGSNQQITRSRSSDCFKDIECREWMAQFLNEGDRYFGKCEEHKKDIKYFFYDCLHDRHELMCSKDVKSIDASRFPSMILLQLRKCSHHTSVASKQLALYFNVDGIFNFTINNMSVHFLRPPPHKCNEEGHGVNANKETRQREYSIFNDNVQPPSLSVSQIGGRQQQIDCHLNQIDAIVLQQRMERKVQGLTQTKSEPMTLCITCRRPLKERPDEVVCSIMCKLDAVKYGIMPKHLSRITCMKHECEIIAEVLKEHHIEVKKGCILKLCLKLMGWESSEDTRPQS